jgi:uncharacterized protein (DUF486 family)
MLTIANVFMTLAWYGHLKSLKHSPLWIAIAVSWGIALLEYIFQVPANRLGSEHLSLAQLKVSQEIITMVVFGLMSVLYFREKFHIDFIWAALCLVGSAFFIFRTKI